MSAGGSGKNDTPEGSSPANPEVKTESYVEEIETGLDNLQKVVAELNSFSKEEVIFEFDSYQKKVDKIAEKYSISLEKREELQDQRDTQ